MMRLALAAAIFATTASVCAAQGNPASHREQDAKYLRVAYQQQIPIALQTAVVRFANSGEQTFVVDLVAAVHYADRDYFEGLNRRFRHYDAVLYELVAPEGLTRPTPVRDRNSYWQLIQTAMGFTSQLEIIDYTAGNLVHADLSPAQMQAAMKSRGDSAITVALSAMADVVRQANMHGQSVGEPDSPSAAQRDAIAFVTENCRPLELKRQLAMQFEQLGSAGTSLGPTLNQLLVTDRNEAAMKVLRRELASGKRKIAIFYGAAHMPDFARRLEDELGLVRHPSVWMDAWDLSKESSVATSPLNLFLELLQSTKKG